VDAHFIVVAAVAVIGMPVAALLIWGIANWRERQAQRR